MNRIIASCKKDLLDLYKEAIEAVKPDRLIKNCIVLNTNELIVRDVIHPTTKSLHYDLNKTRLHVIGGGKCVLAMAKGLSELAIQTSTSGLFSHGCLSVPVHAKASFESDIVAKDLIDALDVTVRFGSKDNLPDADSVSATRNIFDKIAVASEEDVNDGVESIFLVLISGGGSACLTNPKHVSLETKLAVTKRLVQQGADIVELNTVRRYFSEVKGGNLAKYIMSCNPKAQILSLILSDVIGDPIEIIASGPTCLKLNEAQCRQSMLHVAEKYRLELPDIPCTSTSQKSYSDNSVQNMLVGNNKLAINSVLNRAKEMGYTTLFLGSDLTGTTNSIMERILSHSRTFEKSLIVCGGESTVVKESNESWGIGGRVQEIALDYMRLKLSASILQDSSTVDIFLAGSTDGQDGPTDVAACFASFSEWSRRRSFNLDDIARAKKSHDSYNFWMKHQPDWLIKTEPSGTNVMDLYMLMNVSSDDRLDFND